MNTLIPLSNKNIGAETNSVDAREFHIFIQAKSKYADWIKNRIKKYNFQENQDYIIVQTKKQGNNATLKEYYVTFDMAKELAMVENNDKGRKARRYFIEIEKQYRATPTQLDLITPYEVRRDLATARRFLTIEKQKHEATAQHFEAVIKKLENNPINKQLRHDNKMLKQALVKFSNRYHSIVLVAEKKDKAIRKELEIMTNNFQMLPAIENDRENTNQNNLNTNTLAERSYWN